MTVFKNSLWKSEPHQVTILAGECLFEAGDSGRHLYIQLEGEANILVHGHVVEQASAGTLIGEMAILDDEPRSATVRCRTDCTFAVVDLRRFEFLVGQMPFFPLEVMRVMAQRLRATSEML